MISTNVLIPHLMWRRAYFVTNGQNCVEENKIINHMTEGSNCKTQIRLQSLVCSQAGNRPRRLLSTL